MYMDKKFLLNDQEMRKFIVNGYHIVKTSLPPDFHQKIQSRILALIQTEGIPGNNLLSKVPILDNVFTAPAITGALTSILGPDYVMHPHRACHYHPPKSQAQVWHKDYPIGGNIRYHRPRMAMAFYYPQDVSDEMGPTAIQPGTQYFQQYQNMVEGLPLCGQAGTVTIVHYDLWHKATENRSKEIRLMLKFLFCRTEEPQQPSWNLGSCDDFGWNDRSFFLGVNQNIWQHIWEWYLGHHDTRKKTSYTVNPRVEEIMGTVDRSVNQGKISHLGDLYKFGVLGSSLSISRLIKQLRDESKTESTRNLDRSDFTNPSQIPSLYGLAASGKRAITKLVEAINNPDWQVRAAVCGALGCIGKDAKSAVPHLAKALSDDSEWVRRNAAEALGNTGDTSQMTETALLNALDDKRKTSPWSLSDSSLRENAVAALAKVRPSSKSICKLKEASEDENEYIRAWARIGLSRIRYN